MNTEKNEENHLTKSTSANVDFFRTRMIGDSIVHNYFTFLITRQCWYLHLNVVRHILFIILVQKIEIWPYEDLSKLRTDGAVRSMATGAWWTDVCMDVQTDKLIPVCPANYIARSEKTRGVWKLVQIVYHIYEHIWEASVSKCPKLGKTVDGWMDRQLQTVLSYSLQ